MWDEAGSRNSTLFITHRLMMGENKSNNDVITPKHDDELIARDRELDRLIFSFLCSPRCKQAKQKRKEQDKKGENTM